MLKKNLILISMFLAGCQTTAGGLDTPDGRKYQAMMNKNCFVAKTTDGYKSNRGKSPFVVTSVSYGENDWVGASAIAADEGFYDNFYYNTRAKQWICGTETFRAKGYTFVRK